MTLWNNIAELLDYYIPPMPSVYWADITRNCNLRCIMCPQTHGLEARRSPMATDTFRRFIDEVCENEPLIKLYLSGEPLLHDRVFDMAEYADGKGCQTMIHTNATLLSEEMSRRVLSSSLTFITFSFDGCTPEIYERLRPPARFEQVRANIRRYLELRGRDGDTGPHTTVEIIRMKDTEPYLQDFVSQWESSGVDEVHIADCLTWHNGVEDRRGEGDTDGEGYKPCSAPFRHGCILSDGTAVPCCMDVNGRIPLGNITEDSFRTIWTGDAYRRLRLQMLTATYPAGSICDGCSNTLRELT